MSADVCGNEGGMEELSDDLPLIGQIAKLTLRRGDALVLMTKRRLSAREFDGINAEINLFLGKMGLATPIVPVMLLQEGMELRVLDARGLIQLGAVSMEGDAQQA